MATHVRASQYFLQIVKCDDEECCAALTSSLKTVLRDKFFPAPLAITNTMGVKIADPTDHEAKFLNLFQLLSMHLPSAQEDYPYDQFCPTVRSTVDKRICSICKLYFPSQIMVAAHKSAMHPRVKINEVPKVRPIRVAARRQRELMAIIASGEMEDAEWVDESQVDTSGMHVPSGVEESCSLPVIADYGQDPWEID